MIQWQVLCMDHSVIHSPVNQSKSINFWLAEASTSHYATLNFMIFLFLKYGSKTNSKAIQILGPIKKEQKKEKKEPLCNWRLWLWQNIAMGHNNTTHKLKYSNNKQKMLDQLGTGKNQI